MLGKENVHGVVTLNACGQSLKKRILRYCPHFNALATTMTARVLQTGGQPQGHRKKRRTPENADSDDANVVDTVTLITLQGAFAGEQDGREDDTSVVVSRVNGHEIAQAAF